MIHAGFQVQPKLLWESYGQPGGVLPLHGSLYVEGIKNRPELNQQHVEVKDWHPDRGRFAVKSGEFGPLLLKPVNLFASDISDEAAWTISESHLDDLPACVAQRVANALPARMVAAMAGTSRAMRLALWLCPEAQTLWLALLQRGHGPYCVDVVRAVDPTLLGPNMYRVARGLKRIFEKTFELVNGGANDQSEGFQVVACPVARSLVNMQIGAQGAIRKAAGPQSEAAISQLQTISDSLPVTLVTGGALSDRLALTMTEVPHDVLRVFQTLLSEAERQTALITWLNRLHDCLISSVRDAGYRSLSMPTLCTGGIGIPIQFVAIAAARSIHRDFCAHPADPMRIRVCCFESVHLQILRAVKGEVMDSFYKGDVAEDLVSLLHRRRRHPDSDEDDGQHQHIPDDSSDAEDFVSI